MILCAHSIEQQCAWAVGKLTDGLEELDMFDNSIAAGLCHSRNGVGAKQPDQLINVLLTLPTT